MQMHDNWDFRKSTFGRTSPKTRISNILMAGIRGAPFYIVGEGEVVVRMEEFVK